MLDGEYLPDKMQDFAVNFIMRHKDQPFYLYYAMSHVHTPILPTPDSKPGTKDKILCIRTTSPTWTNWSANSSPNSTA